MPYNLSPTYLYGTVRRIVDFCNSAAPQTQHVVIWTNKRMLVLNKKGNILKLSYWAFTKYLLIIPPAKDDKFSFFQSSGLGIKAGCLLHRRVNCGILWALMKGVSPINHHIRHSKNHSLSEEEKVIITQVCSMKEQLTMWKFAKMQIRE